MNIKIILGVIVLAVVAGLGYMWYSEEAKENEAKEFMNSYQAPVVTESTTTSSSTTSDAVGAQTAPVAKTSFTLADIAAHASATDCWMAIDGSVYNVSAFVSKHPGGEVIVQGCGKDATEMFNQVPKHLRGAAKMWLTKLKIGTLAQ